MYALIDTDGTRYVVWGVGATPQMALADAKSNSEYRLTEQASFAAIDNERAARVTAGDVSADDLLDDSWM